MAKNTGDGFRRGAVTGRTQVERPDGKWQKRDERSGRLMEVKQTPVTDADAPEDVDGRTKSGHDG